MVLLASQLNGGGEGLVGVEDGRDDEGKDTEGHHDPPHFPPHRSLGQTEVTEPVSRGPDIEARVSLSTDTVSFTKLHPGHFTITDRQTQKY